jgi:hypothetical protein
MQWLLTHLHTHRSLGTQEMMQASQKPDSENEKTIVRFAVQAIHKHVLPLAYYRRNGLQMNGLCDSQSRRILILLIDASCLVLIPRPRLARLP